MAHELARSRMADQQRLTFTPFTKGDQVLLDSRNLKTIYHKKMTPELVEEEGVYEVETIRGHRKQGRGYQYYIQWWGYPISDASWEPEHAFSDDGKILADYKKCHHL